MRPQNTLTKAPKALRDLERERRRFLLSCGRQRATQNLLTAFSGLSLAPTATGLALASADSLTGLDPQTHFVRLIPRGPRVRIASQFGQVTVSFPKSGKRMTFDEPREPFVVLAVFDASQKTFWATELLSFRSFNYQRVSFRVGRYLARSHFPAELMCSFGGYKLRKLPEEPFSNELLSELSHSRLLQSRHVEITSVETGNALRVSAPSRVLKRKLSLFFGLRNGHLATADGHLLSMAPVSSHSADGVRLSVSFQRSKLLQQLLSLLSERPEGAMEVESESGLTEALLSLARPLVLGKRKRLVLTRRAACEKVSSALEQGRAAIDSRSFN